MSKNKDFVKRESGIERLDFHSRKNLFCERARLTNEAAVETFFVIPLLRDLGYGNKNIKTKESLDTFKVAKGSKKENYKPDYVIVNRNKPVLVLDAKHPNENLHNHTGQCAFYCLSLNQPKKTAKYFVLTNGIKTALYKGDEYKTPLMELDFEDFYSGGELYEKLRKILDLSALSQDGEVEDLAEPMITLKKLDKETAQKIFASCHKTIWNAEKRSPNSAFIEFVKLILVKLWNDRILHDRYMTDAKSDLRVPISANTFSINWIESRENDMMLNPVNAILFKTLLSLLQDEVDRRKKKPMFEDSDNIELKPTTIKEVVKKLERYDLFGIDEDLNGRLFETFLNATMRGAALGQYFTPRSIVLLGTLLADIKVETKHADKVLDASCGTGGYLIEAFTIMRNKIRDNQSYSKGEKQALIRKISNESIFGIDAAKDPMLARIARINMYLHGDGGSHIYYGDGLEKKIAPDKTDSRHIQIETEDMRDNLKPNSIDVVLTNPPFSMWYSLQDETQKKILEEYELLGTEEGTNKKRNRLRGSAMFIERYHGLLKAGGKLLSIIDETILSSADYSYVRDYIREKFIIRAIISLPGDAFRMANARVKTAMIYLEKKKTLNDEQPAAFMYPSVALGIDDMPITTTPSKIAEARKNASLEITRIVDEFAKFRNGKSGEWLVAPERLTDRLDVKFCIPQFGRFVPTWKKKGYKTEKLECLCNLREETIKPKADMPNDKFRILTITYDGRCKADEIRYGRDINYSNMKIARTGDIVFSEYNAFHGAIGYITEDFDGTLASGSYTIVRCHNIEDSLYLCAILRSTEIRADLLTAAVGMGRQTISWDDIKNVEIPLLPKEQRIKISNQILVAWQKEKEAIESIASVRDLLNKEFNVESDESQRRFMESKPPR
jgi:type I restriction enzyme M protein